MVDKTVEEKIASAPASAGVYIFKDNRNRVTYIGKAKNLGNRLKSYVAPSATLDIRKREMIRTAKDVSFIVTENELEALALEANLIKQNKPKYNVVLRDDKNYPYIRIDLHEEWPRIEVVRRIKKDQALYFGPYIPAAGMRETISIIRRFFNIRPCGYSLAKPMKPCVQYQMGRCPAPCDGHISREDYMREVEEVIDFLKGKNRSLIERLKRKMRELSSKLMFEEAARIRDRIKAVEKTWDLQKVVSPRLDDADIIGFHPGERDVAFVVMFIRNGIMTGAKEFLLKNASDIRKGELMHAFIQIFYSARIIPPSRIAAVFLPDDADNLGRWLSERKGKRVMIESPQKGLKRSLIKMACDNAEVFLRYNRAPDYGDIINAIQAEFHLVKTPESIGAFDVSTIQGTGSVGAFIFWEYGRFQKEFYRYVNIKSVEGINDYSMMEETVKRILTGIRDNVPDLVVIDGGKGQLEIAHRAVSRLDLPSEPEIIAIAKDPDRVFKRGWEEGISIEDGRPSSLLLKAIRDEAHRFAITRHRKARMGMLLESSLEQVPGIGKRRRLSLLRRFGTIDAVKKASIEEIAGLKGMNSALALKIKERLADTHSRK